MAAAQVTAAHRFCPWPWNSHLPWAQPENIKQASQEKKQREDGKMARWGRRSPRHSLHFPVLLGQWCGCDSGGGFDSDWKNPSPVPAPPTMAPLSHLRGCGCHFEVPAASRPMRPMTFVSQVYVEGEPTPGRNQRWKVQLLAAQVWEELAARK